MAAVAAGGAAGAVLRYLLTDWHPDGHGFPATTFAINVVGSGLLALLPAISRVRRSRAWTAALGPGLLGGFTTLSAYGEQTRALLDAGRPILAGGYALGSVAACCLVVVLVRSALPAPPAVMPGPERAVTVLLVALGAAVGAPLRFCLATWLDSPAHRVPRGTLAVNTAGSFLLGTLVGAAASGDTLALLGTGFCGGLTTFSAFAVQTVDRRDWLYPALTVVLAVTAAACGFALAQA